MPKETISSSESDSDDETDNLAKLREAADIDLINDHMFEQVGRKSEVNTADANPPKLKESQRNIEANTGHIDDLLIPQEVQKFVSKKLTKIIEGLVEFVDVDQNGYETKTEVTEERFKLLDDVMLKINWNKIEETVRDQRKKPQIKRRKLSDVHDSKSESMRLNEAVIDVRCFREEVSNWRTKPKGALFEYHQKNGKLSEVVAKTEFSEKRVKNNWDEIKISKNKNIFR